MTFWAAHHGTRVHYVSPPGSPLALLQLAESHRVSLAHALSCIPRRLNKTPKKASIQTCICMSVPGTSYTGFQILEFISINYLGPRAVCALVHVRAYARHPIYSLDVSGMLKRSQNRGHKLDPAGPCPVHALDFCRVLEPSAPHCHVFHLT